MYFFFSCPTELVEIFFVDTTPFVEEYFTEPQEHKYDWRGIGPQKPYITNLLKVCIEYIIWICSWHFNYSTIWYFKNKYS